MSTTGVLDDYLDELLGEAIVAPPPVAVAVAVAAPEREPTWDDLPAEVIYETEDAPAAVQSDSAALEAAFDAVAVAAPEREPTWDDLSAEVIYETEDVQAAAQSDSAALEAAFDAVAVAAPEREPTWDDLPADVIYETEDTDGSAGPRPASAAAPAPAAPTGPEPTWDDLPDEVIYETDSADSHALAHIDSPALQAAFEAAAEGETVAVPAPATVAPALPPAATVAAAPVARTAVAPPPRVAVNAPAGARPSSWQELQSQAHQPASSPHPQARRAGERTSRWLRLRCGVQAYALELLKVQEVVLPVPLLPLRGTAAAMLGIMNLRGQVVPVMDLGLHLGTTTAEDDAQTRIVVLEENGEILGLRVSAVEDVANLTDSQIEPPDTARICQISNDLFRGVARIGQRPMILLDATRLLG
ncbi:chemotaxis protein CheW [Stenotrophomonas sp. YAU14D1_LEIMI4_1]|uniref:chemotaxis protein CheW n=1 Tax=Stenotrophomonas sp. YAU14D1_LEIMI4_1 TaxID=2072407 RepID=UPI000D53F796|nr:chemotaxis protein CheW [Stenotrophomonas sp. YAU14D1_LEIMI4_1]AWH25279.1 chemotaxis protein CheW [Stenotrophomonas sp. YAU14D1_LEIMI4_1]